MNYYTSQIPLTLAEKLKKKGIHQLRDSKMEGWLNSGDNITYAEVFDWLINKGFDIIIYPSRNRISGLVKCYMPSIDGHPLDFTKTWHEAANKAIEKALILI